MNKFKRACVILTSSLLFFVMFNSSFAMENEKDTIDKNGEEEKKIHKEKLDEIGKDKFKKDIIIDKNVEINNLNEKKVLNIGIEYFNILFHCGENRYVSSFLANYFLLEYIKQIRNKESKLKKYPQYKILSEPSFKSNKNIYKYGKLELNNKIEKDYLDFKRETYDRIKDGMGYSLDVKLRKVLPDIKSDYGVYFSQDVDMMAFFLNILKDLQKEVKNIRFLKSKVLSLKESDENKKEFEKALYEANKCFKKHRYH